MKTALKCENNEILVLTIKHVSGLTSHANLPETPKLWAIAHENGHKTRKDEFLVITLKHVNRVGTPKLWAVAH